MNFIIDNWFALLGLLSAPIMWVLGGRQAKNVEIKKGTADALGSMQLVYDKYIEHDKIRTEKLELRLDFLEKQNAELQTQFNQMQLAYSKEIEASKYWKDKFDHLETKYTLLEKDHDGLKKAFENFKKANK